MSSARREPSPGWPGTASQAPQRSGSSTRPVAEGSGGWSATSTVIDIVNDDMPYVVESVISAITAAGVTVHRVLHPILAVRRDVDGTLVEVAGESRRGLDPRAASGILGAHTDRPALRRGTRRGIEAALHDALEAVRAVVTDSAALIGAAAVVATRTALQLLPPVHPGGVRGRRTSCTGSPPAT